MTPIPEAEPLEDVDLVECARRGDVDAYEEIVRRYQDLAFRTAFIITRDGAEAEDAAQEAFVKAYYALARFRVGAPLRPWLLRIVANEARNRRKAAGRRAGLTLQVAAACTAVELAASPELHALAAERRELLLRALNALRDDDRLVIAYRYFFELSEAEMASALGCARGTVKSRLAHALQRLRRALAGFGVDETWIAAGGRKEPGSD